MLQKHRTSLGQTDFALESSSIHKPSEPGDLPLFTASRPGHTALFTVTRQTRRTRVSHLLQAKDPAPPHLKPAVKHLAPSPHTHTPAAAAGTHRSNRTALYQRKIPAKRSTSVFLQVSGQPPISFKTPIHASISNRLMIGS